MKAQKRIAVSAGILRQRAATNFDIEIKLLLKASDRADALRQAAQAANRDDLSSSLAGVNLEVRDFMNAMNSMLPYEFSKLKGATENAIATKDYRELSEIEAQLREGFESLTIQARGHLSELHRVTGATMDAGIGQRR